MDAMRSWLLIWVAVVTACSGENVDGTKQAAAGAAGASAAVDSGGGTVDGAAGMGGAQSCSVGAATNPSDPSVLVAQSSNDPACPATPDAEGCALDGTVCSYEVPCQSGTITFPYQCEGGVLYGGGYGDIACDLLHDSCPIIKKTCEQYTDGSVGWTPAGGTDDPPICPWDRPAEGSTCKLGLYGGGRCGFWCGEEHATWTIATCEPKAHPGTGGSGGNYAYEGTWKFDDACRADCP